MFVALLGVTAATRVACSPSLSSIESLSNVTPVTCTSSGVCPSVSNANCILLLNSSSKSSNVIGCASSLISDILCILNAIYFVLLSVVNVSPFFNNVDLTSSWFSFTSLAVKTRFSPVICASYCWFGSTSKYPSTHILSVPFAK